MKDLEASAEAARFKLEQGRQRHAEIDANQAERLQARMGRFRADASDHSAAEAAHRREVATTGAATTERESKLAAERFTELKRTRAALKNDGVKELDHLKRELAAAEKDANAAEAARRDAIEKRRDAYRRPCGRPVLQCFKRTPPSAAKIIEDGTRLHGISSPRPWRRRDLSRRDFASPEYPRRGRGVAATCLAATCLRGMDTTSPRLVSPRLVSTDYPRRGVAASRLRGIVSTSASRPAYLAE